MATFIVRWSFLALTLFQLFTPTKTAAPQFTGLPIILYIGSLEVGTRLLYIFDIVDPNGDSFTCDLTIDGRLAGAAVMDNDNEFVLKYNTKNAYYELWSNSATFDPTVIDEFIDSVVCTDTNNEASTGNNAVEVVVVDGKELTINNVEGTTISVPALTTDQEVDLKTVSSSLTGAGTVEYSIVSTSPSADPSYFRIDSSTGILTTNRELKFFDTLEGSTAYVTIKARDTQDNIETYAVQTIELTDQNTLAVFTNMLDPLNPLEVEVLESVTAGDILFTADKYDPDIGQTHTITHTCVPEAAANLFEVDNVGNFMVAADQVLDYETLPSITCSLYIDDTIEPNGPFDVVLTIGDDNDTPSFTDIMYYVSTAEGSKGSLSFTPGFDCTDEDSGDSITYFFQPFNSSDNFGVDSTGVMTFATDYDIDGPSAKSAIVILTACCEDSGHITGAANSKTSCAQVTVTITDVNDNEPTFSSPKYTFVIDESYTTGTAVGTVVVTDNDLTEPNSLSKCEDPAIACYSVTPDCLVYLSCDATPGVISFPVTSTDGGNPQQTGTTSVAVVVQATTTTTTTVATTTPESYDFFDWPVNIFFLIFSILMGLALLGLLTWCLLRMCCPGVCGGMCGGGRGGMCDCGYSGRSKRNVRHHRRAVTPEPESPRPQRTRIKEEAPRTIVQEKRPVQVIRSMGPSPYVRQLPMKVPLRTAPALPPGYFP